MKVRMQLNNNTHQYAGTVYQDGKNIVLVKTDNTTIKDAILKKFIFKGFAELFDYMKSAEWINAKEIKLVSNFK